MQRWLGGMVLGLVVGMGVSQLFLQPAGVQGQTKEPEHRVFELRTYHAPKGKLDALNARFRNHTTKLFEKHGMKNVIYLTPLDPAKQETDLVYLVSHATREAADANWKAFIDDPEWKKAHAESEKDGKLVDKIEREYLIPTDYSPIKK